MDPSSESICVWCACFARGQEVDPTAFPAELCLLRFAERRTQLIYKAALSQL